MKKLLVLICSVLAAVPVQTIPAYAGTADDCAKSYKINVDKPVKDDDDAEASVKNRCKTAGGNSGCAQSYNFMWRKFNEYSLRSGSICRKVMENQANQTGENRAAFSEATALSSGAKEGLDELRKHQEEDMTTLSKFRNQNFQNAEKAVEKSDAATKKAVADSVKQLKGYSSISEKDHEALIKKLSGTKLPDAAKDELRAAIDATRFTTMVGQDAKGRAAAADTLKGQAGSTAENEKKSGSSGFGMSDAAGALGLATAGLGLMSALQGQKSAAAPASDLSSPTAAAPAAEPAVTSLPNAEVGGSSVGSSTGGTSFSAPGDGQSVAKIDNGQGAPEHGTPAASLSDPKEGVLSQFAGSLGGSPFSGSSTSSGGGAGMAGGEAGGGREPGSDSASGAGAHGAGGDAALLPMSGGVPGFAGGSSSAGGAEASLKDLFKGGDPFAMPNLGAGAPGAGADLALGVTDTAGLDGALGVNLESDGQAGLIPGANDGRTLFARVREFHNRCVKKGLVTSEAGGKI